MTKAVLSSSLLPSLPRAVAGGATRLPTLPSLGRSGCRRAAGCKVRANLPGLDSVGGLHAALERAEATLYTLADAAVVAGAGGAGSAGGDVEQAVQMSGDWFGLISDAMEVVLKIELPEWVDIVKTARFMEPPPYDPDCYYIRAASVARKIYGGRQRNGSRPPHFYKSSSALSRNILQQLKNMGIINHDPKGVRLITSQGERRDLDHVAGRVAE